MCPSGTNINDAMLMAVQLLERANREELLPAKSVTLIILLTDGDPTVGEALLAAPGHVPRGSSLAPPGLLWDLGAGEGSLRPL